MNIKSLKLPVCLNFWWSSCVAPSLVRDKKKKKEGMLGQKKEKTHRCVGHLVCAKGSNISQQIANMQWHRHSGCWKGELSSSPHRAQRTHWCNEARVSLAFKCYASMGPDQKTNGDRSPIRPERDEVKRVCLQLHKYLAQCQFDVRICRVSWAAQGCTGPRELHCSPWTGWRQAPAFPSQLLQCLG